MRNQAQLITYADRFGGTLRGLADLLRGPLAGALSGGVHVLPFYVPIDRADAGFDPTDHTQVDPRLGSWEDVAELAEVVPVMADVIVNHVSTASPQFRDFRARGNASPYAGMFLTHGRVFPDGATEEQLLALYRPRPGLPMTDMTLEDRTRRILWTTFTSEQVDLDVSDPQTIAYLQTILDRLAHAGVSMARLDAIGYAVKTPGTSCFMTDDTYAFISELEGWCDERGIEPLVEIHAHYEEQLRTARAAPWIYDFALPPLALHALFTGRAEALGRWLRIRPHNAVTVLDTHDGIGVLDVGPDQRDRDRSGLLAPEQIDELVETIHRNSDGASRLATGSAASNVDLYQVNTTYYDALARDDHAYLIARLLQVFLPGVPQIYYVGLLAGTNDLDLLERTGVGRDINRHRYLPHEIDEALARPVVQQLMALLRLRNTHPAFGGEWTLITAEGSRVAMEWLHGSDRAALTIDFAKPAFTLAFNENGHMRRVEDLAELDC